MRYFLNAFSNSLRDSVLARLGLAMGFLALLSFISIVISTVIADNISGKASTINLSGSLRMMSFRTLSEIQQPERRRLAINTIEQFERRLDSLNRFIHAKSSSNEPLAEANQIILERWQIHIRPLARAAAEGNPEAITQMASDIPSFVAEIDQVVLLIEQDLERKIHLLRATQFALLAIIIAVSLVTTWMLRQHLVRPLAELLKAAKTVSQGSFSVKVTHETSDELGQLGHAFNTMVGEIAHMYANLELKVEEKTRELTKTNQSLELLYRTSQQLSASELSLENIQAVLRDIENELELGHSMICISEHGALPAHPLLGDLSADELNGLCGQQNCKKCFDTSRISLETQFKQLEHNRESQPILFVPMGDGNENSSMRTALPIFMKGKPPLTREKLRIIETVSHHVSNALSSMRRAEEKHRLAVLEERTVIARELHDSIAQALSYLKIQVTRLEKNLSNPEDARVIAQELKTGLNSAYRELRELITTFRLRIDERGFNAALQETIEEFSNKLGFRVELQNTLPSIALSANEEMHVIRIIREALSNIERHAQASAASITIFVSPTHFLSATISDNGCGFDPNTIPPNHYGTSIMKDRAQILQGELTVNSTLGTGTQITLQFLPQKYRSTSSV